MKVSQNCPTSKKRSTIEAYWCFSRPHPGPLPEGEGGIGSRLRSALSLWERERVREDRGTISDS